MKDTNWKQLMETYRKAVESTRAKFPSDGGYPWVRFDPGTVNYFRPLAFRNKPLFVSVAKHNIRNQGSFASIPCNRLNADRECLICRSFDDEDRPRVSAYFICALYDKQNKRWFQVGTCEVSLRRWEDVYNEAEMFYQEEDVFPFGSKAGIILKMRKSDPHDKRSPWVVSLAPSRIIEGAPAIPPDLIKSVAEIDLTKLAATWDDDRVRKALSAVGITLDELDDDDVSAEEDSDALDDVIGGEDDGEDSDALDDVIGGEDDGEDSDALDDVIGGEDDGEDPELPF